MIGRRYRLCLGPAIVALGLLGLTAMVNRIHHCLLCFMVSAVYGLGRKVNGHGQSLRQHASSTMCNVLPPPCNAHRGSKLQEKKKGGVKGRERKLFIHEWPPLWRALFISLGAGRLAQGRATRKNPDVHGFHSSAV